MRRRLDQLGGLVVQAGVEGRVNLWVTVSHLLPLRVETGGGTAHLDEIISTLWVHGLILYHFVPKLIGQSLKGGLLVGNVCFGHLV